jgi:hypothetical protein
MNSIPKLCWFALVCSSAAFAQATAGSGAVGGTIRDTYGDGIPDTTIEVTNETLGLHQSVMTTDDGVFYVPALPPAPGYKVKVTRSGFIDWNSAPITVSVGETLSFRIDLQADATSRRVTGKAGAVVDDHQLSGDTVLGEQQVDGLPLRQRKVDPLILQALTANGGATNAKLSILGQGLSKEILTDGLVTSSGYFTQQQPLPNTVSLGTLEGVQVIYADPSAEIRDGMTGTINTATRGGTNSFHGAAYEYLRLPGLTAAGRFSLGNTLLHGRNQTGAGVSGPILADRLFFFTNLEILNDHFDGLNRITNPAIADPGGLTVTVANCKATAALCANAIKFIQSQMNIQVPLSQRALNGIARLDYQFSGNNRINLEFNLANSLAPNAQQVANAVSNGGLLGIVRNTRDDSRFVKLAWTTTPGASVFNEVRVGLAQNHFFQPATYSPGLSTGGYDALNLENASIGNSTTGSNLNIEQSYQIVDNFTASGGPNTIEFGVDYSRDHYYINQLNTDGEYFYSSLTNFASDLGTTTGKNYSYYTQSFGVPRSDLSYKQIGVYGQNTLKLSKKLTLNFGLRWEKPSNPQPPVYNTAYYQTASIASPNLDLIPRVGIAYQLNPKTAIRGGFGYFFTPFYGQLLDALYLGGAQAQQSQLAAINPTQTNSPAFPKTITTSIPPGGVTELMYSSSKLRNPHTQQASLAIERELPAGATVSASYINSRGYKLWTATDSNLASATKTATFTIDNAAGTKVGSFPLPVITARNDNNYSHVYDVENGGSSWYNAMAVELRKRMSHGITLQASYTWSHAIDDAQGPMIQGGVPLVTPLIYNSSNRDSSTTDQRQRLTLNATWQPTVTAGDSILARYFINGWQISTIGTIATGLPQTAEVIASGAQVSGITPFFSGTLDGSGAWDRVPFYPVASFRSGTQDNWNLRFTRALPFTERVKGLLMFEAFNLLNSQPITGVNTIAFTATSGVLHPAPGVGTGNAAVGYPYQTNARSCQVAFRVTF